MVKKIKLTQNKYAMVDNIDYEWLNQYPWCAHKKKVKTAEDLWYVSRTVKRKDGSRTTCKIHRAIMEKILEEEGNFELLKKFKENPRKYPIDHIDGNGLKNTRDNLRIVTHRQNMQNLNKKQFTSKYPGVYWDKDRSKWAVYIRITPEARKWIGRFDNEEQAFKEYRKAVKKYCNEDVIPELQYTFH
jgi:hypothetical protein